MLISSCEPGSDRCPGAAATNLIDAGTVRDRVEAVFRGCDASGRGLIDRSRLEVALELLAVPLSASERALLPQVLDRATDARSGELDYALFVDWLFGVVPGFAARGRDDHPIPCPLADVATDAEQEEIESAAVPIEERMAQLSPASPASSSLRWRVGETVERLLDDVSDIWIGAVVSAASPTGVYTVRYADDDAEEDGVEACELRWRTAQLPEEVWARACGFLSDASHLCFVEGASKGSRLALAGQAQRLWCIAYHCRFGRCGTRCPLKTVPRESEEMLPTALIASTCEHVAYEPNLSPTKYRKPWKERFAQRFMDERMQRLELTACEQPAAQSIRSHHLGSGGVCVLRTSPSKAALDDRLRFGRDALRGEYYDPVLGCYVAEDGGQRSPITIRRGRTAYSY